jgi:hypothetical protein
MEELARSSRLPFFLSAGIAGYVEYEYEYE